MTTTGQGRRRYDARSRQQQARENRERILRVARRLFEADGYGGTSVARIATEAGVSSPTVFAAFGSKVGLLKSALETAVAGDAEDIPLIDRPVVRRIHDAPGAAEVLDRIADAVTEIAGRAYRMFTVVHAAADADPEIARMLAVIEDQRLTGATGFATTLADRLGDPARIPYLRDTIWALTSPLHYRLLVGERGWPPEQYRDWISRALTALAR